MNRVRKGNYYRLRTKKFLEKEGYLVENLEKSQRLFIKGKNPPYDDKVIFIKKDIFGGDLIAMKKDELIFVQCKSNSVDINKGVNEFKKFPFPDFVKKWVVYWQPRSKEPNITEI